MQLFFCDVKCFLVGTVVFGILSGDGFATEKLETIIKLQDRAGSPPFKLLNATSGSENVTLEWKANETDNDYKYVKSIKLTCINEETGITRNATSAVNGTLVYTHLTQLTINNTYNCTTFFVGAKQVKPFKYSITRKELDKKLISRSGSFRDTSDEVPSTLLNVTIKTIKATFIIIEWSFSNSSFNTNETASLTINCSNNGSSTTNTYTFETKAHLGITQTNMTNLSPGFYYSCNATIKSETADLNYTMFHFQTRSLPGPPKVHLTPQSTVIDVEWNASDELDDILTYTLEIRSLGPMYERSDNCAPDNYTKNWTFPKNVTHHTIASLNPFTKYRILMREITAEGAGDIYEEDAETLQQLPEKVEINDVTYPGHTRDHLTVNITWELPCLVNGPHNDTRVLLEGIPTEGNEQTNLERYVGKSLHLVTNVTYSTKYTVMIWLLLEDEEMGKQGVHTFETPIGFPGQVTSLQVSQNGNSSLDITWGPPVPEERRGKITNYLVDVTALEPGFNVPADCKIHKNHNYNTSTVEYSTTNYTFTVNPVYHYYSYEIGVTASTDKGFGDRKRQINNYFESVPENVENLTVEIENKISEVYEANATINFTTSCFLNGPLENYTLFYEGKGKLGETLMNSINITGAYTFNLRPEYTYSYYITTHTKNYQNTTFGRNFKAPAGVPKLNISVNEISISTKENSAGVTLKKEYFDGKNGEVSFVALLLANSSDPGGEAKNYSRNDKWPIPSDDDPMEMKTIMKNPFESTQVIDIVIGNETSCDASKIYCNTPLEPAQDYYLIVRAYTNEFYRNSPTIHFRTADLSHLDLILGILFGVLFVVLAVFVAFFVWRRKCIKISDLIMLPAVISPRKSTEQQNVSLGTSYPPKKFISYYKHLENNRDILKEQFACLREKSLELGETLKIHFAKLPENRRKNRYTNISPYDETRVKLMIDEDDEIGSDYINASYIKGYTGEVEYIATQGPLESTCRDFWKMILQENVSMIVMVSLFIEQDKMKCHRYFPKNHETMIVGDDIEVKCSVELHFGIYCVRTLHIRKDNFQTYVTHMQFLDWPDFGVPGSTDHMLQFCYQMRDRIQLEEGVIVVHCSAGVGRTGTLIATDILIQTANTGKNIDVYNTVEMLRTQRMNMVQTEEQFFYIHKLIMEHLDRPQTPDLMQNPSPIYENMSIIDNCTDSKTKYEKQIEENSF